MSNYVDFKGGKMESYIKHGDYLEVMKDIPDKSINMILSLTVQRNVNGMLLFRLIDCGSNTAE